jgi:hypothetical protein
LDDDPLTRCKRERGNVVRLSPVQQAFIEQ